MKGHKFVPGFLCEAVEYNVSSEIAIVPWIKHAHNFLNQNTKLTQMCIVAHARKYGNTQILLLQGLWNIFLKTSYIFVPYDHNWP
jgi:hypothetical protein